MKKRNIKIVQLFLIIIFNNFINTSMYNILVIINSS